MHRRTPTASAAAADPKPEEIMRARINRGIVAATGVAAVAVVGMAGVGHAAGDDDDLKAVGLASSGTKLVLFETGQPKKLKNLGTVSGLDMDTSLIGIDYRVQDGKLYGVGDQGGIYTLSGKSAKATKVSQLTVSLDGQSFGVDFNPAANRLRVISDTGQNLRHNIDDGATAGTTVADTALTTPPATATTTGVTAAAYTNNDLNADTGTTLYDIDSNLDQVAIQAPANNGTLSATGKLGVDAGSAAGFDIYSVLRKGKTSSVVGFATLSVGGKSALYRINLGTGEATSLGGFSSTVTDLAVQLDK
jgi:hypothetical protein